MSLRILPAMEQRSPEWYAARCGMVTASAVGALLSVSAPGARHYDCPDCLAEAGEPCISKVSKPKTPIKTMHPARIAVADENAATAAPIVTTATGDTAKSLTLALVAERITQYVEPTFVSEAMWRGIEDEPLARDKYAEHYGVPVTEVGFMVRDDWGFSIGFSPDGLVGDDGLIEVKSRNQKRQVGTVLADDVPAENLAQIQCGLLVSGRSWCDYVSYAGGMHMWTKRVLPDPVWQAAIIEAVRAFETTAADMVDTYLSRVVGLPMTERIDDPTNLGLEF